MSHSEGTSEPGIAAQNFFQLSIYGERKEHVISLRLQRERGMTIGDMAQLQNYFWVSLGEAIRKNEELRRHLAHAGFEVLLDDPNAPVPVSAN
jgi:hypothetical protein